MKKKQLRTDSKANKGFRVALGNRRSQAAEMILPPADAEGDPKNRHQGADQWLFVVAGRGTARINGRRYSLKAGSLLLIERNDRHEIKNTGNTALRTLYFYVPPAYSKSGEPLRRARPGGS
jgi:mannose-6-phosphate isomerase-like protein (cupin superfamily)